MKVKPVTPTHSPGYAVMSTTQQTGLTDLTLGPSLTWRWAGRRRLKTIC